MKTAQDMLNEKEGGEALISVAADTTIHDALKVMLELRIGAILVEENGKQIGIWTERDLMENAITPGFDPKTAKIGDLMVTGLQSASYAETAYNLLDKFLGIRLRHLLIEKDGEYIGLLSTGDVIKTCLMEKTAELENLNSIVSWDYYEDWRWKKK